MASMKSALLFLLQSIVAGLAVAFIVVLIRPAEKGRFKVPLISALFLYFDTGRFAAGPVYRQDDRCTGTWCGTNCALYTGVIEIG